MSLNRLCLVINASYEAINVTSAQRALTLVLKGAAVVEEVSGYAIRTSKSNIPVPSVVRLMKYRRMPRQNRSVSRKGILLRDGSSCQYCGARLPSGSLSMANCQIGLSAVVCEVLIPLPECATSLSYSFI